jgi:phage terminase large subunit
MQIQLKTKNPKQIKAAGYWLDNETEELLYGGAKGGGKSFLGCSLIFGDALIYPETHYFIARGSLTDLKKFTIPSIEEVFQVWKLKIKDYANFNGQDNFYRLYNGSKVFLIECKLNPGDPMFERFGSMQMTRGWIEEGGEVCEAAKSNLWLSVGRWKNDAYGLKKKLLITANPKKGWMKREFVDLWKQKLLPKNRKFVQAFATDNKYLPEDYVASLRNEKDPVRRQRLWEGSWDYDEDQDSLISYDALSDTFSNAITKDGKKYLIIDVARLGKDTTTFNYWDGLELIKIEVFEKQDTQKTIQMAKDRAAAERIPYSHIMIDEDGIGGAVVDGMWGVRGFVANSSPIPTATEIRAKQNKVENSFIPKANFANLKSQCAWKVAELINEHKIAFAVPEYREKIIEELTALLRQKDVDNDRKLQIKPKDEVKEELGKSPDIGDPIIYRAWFELQKEASIDNPEREVAISLQKIRFASNREKLKINSTR